MDEKTAEALKAYMDICDEAIWYLTEHCSDDPSIRELIADQRKKREALHDLLFVGGNPPWEVT